MDRASLASLFVLVFNITGLPAHAQTWITFSVPNGTDTYVNAVNDNGDVTGVDQVYTGFIRTVDGVFATFEPPNGRLIFTALNNARTVTGPFRDGDDNIRGFLRDAQGEIQVFDVGVPFDTQPVAINSSGQIAGFYQERAYEGFVRDPDGTIMTFTDESNDLISSGINNAGFIIGNAGLAGFIRDPAGMISESKQSSFSSYPIAINDGGTIAGYVQGFSGITYGFVRTAHGPSQFFRANASFGTFVTGINSNGTVSGYYYGPGNKLARGFIRSANGTITLLDCPGFIQTIPVGITSTGVIAGTCEQQFGAGAVGFLYTP